VRRARRRRRDRARRSRRGRSSLPRDRPLQKSHDPLICMRERVAAERRWRTMRQTDVELETRGVGEAPRRRSPRSRRWSHGGAAHSLAVGRLSGVRSSVEPHEVD
jgi:hypothetical protein